MTKRVKIGYDCPNCGERYTAYTYTSYYSKHGKPKDFEKSPICPRCSTPYFKKKPVSKKK